MKLLQLSILLLITLPSLKAQVIPISQARASAVGTTVTVRGIVTNGQELDVIRYLQDPSGGIAAYSPAMNEVIPGDSIEVTGTLKQFNSLLEIDPVSSFTVITQGNPLPQPITLTDLTAAFSETYEGVLVKITGINFVNAGMFSGAVNYKVSKSGFPNKDVRIGASTTLVGKFIPTKSADVIGIMSQFNSSYQLLPRYPSDIIGDHGPLIISSVDQEEITQTSFRIFFKTQNPGSTIVRIGLTPALEMSPNINNLMGTLHYPNIAGLTSATPYYIKIQTVNSTGDTSETPVLRMSTASGSSGDIKVYFNSSTLTQLSHGKDAVRLVHAIDDTLINYINRAKSTLDIAIYNWNNNGLSDMSAAVNAAFSRGVKIRIVADGSTANLALQSLNSSIQIIKSPQGSNYSIMHNKFIIIDAESVNDAIVWTGSTNLTEGQINDDPNNVIIIQDQALARAYRIEFEEMWGSNGDAPNAANAKFGQFKTDNTPHQFYINGKWIGLYFSPSDGVNRQLINTINSANRDLYFSVLNITRSDVARAIRDRGNAGVYASGMVNDTGATGSGTAFLTYKNGIGNGALIYNSIGILHHKYLIADPNDYYSDPTVFTGSHNWSNNAETRNDENTLIIRDAEIANIYFQEYAARFEENTGNRPKNIANFKASKTQVMIGDTVYFTDLSSGPDNQWLWSFGDNQSSSLENPFHIYNSGGQFSVSLISGTGTNSDTIIQLILIRVDVPSAVSEISDDIPFVLFPNPSNSLINIKTSAGFYPVHTKIYTVTGIEKMNGDFNPEINISSLESGIYFIELIDKNRSSRTSRFIKY